MCERCPEAPRDFACNEAGQFCNNNQHHFASHPPCQSDLSTSTSAFVPVSFLQCLSLYPVGHRQEAAEAGGEAREEGGPQGRLGVELEMAEDDAMELLGRLARDFNVREPRKLLNSLLSGSPLPPVSESLHFLPRSDWPQPSRGPSFEADQPSAKTVW